MRRRPRAPLCLVLVLVAAACGAPTDEAQTIWHDPDLAAAAAGATPSQSASGTMPAPPAADAMTSPPADRGPATGAPAAPTTSPAEASERGQGGDGRALEVIVRRASLELGWTDEAPEAIAGWPPAAATADAVLPELVRGATDYAQRERAAAAQRPGHAFDGFARVRVETGSLSSNDGLITIVRSLEAAGFGRVGLHMGQAPLELSLPLLPRAPVVADGEEAGLSFARLRWGRSQEGHWIDGDVAISGPEQSVATPVDARPDLPVGLRSAWSCALVEPEPTFTDAVRRATSAMKTFQLPADLPVYVELAPGTSFEEAWQLATEMRANGHDRISFLRGRSTGGVPSSCPSDVGNALKLRASSSRYLAQARVEGERLGAGLEFLATGGPD